ncbi:hypothetical protein REPUB_Repub05bG0042300 [Reevesia pubescens]
MKQYSDVQKVVKVQKMQDKTIDKKLDDCLEKSDNVLKDAQSLENEMLVETEPCSRCIPYWLWQFRLRKKVAKKTRAITEVLKTLKTESIRMFQSEIWSSRTLLQPSKSWNLAYNNIMEALEDNDVRIVALCGIGGVGKTTLAKEVRKKALELGLFYEVVMVVVSQHPVCPEIQNRIADCLKLEFNDEDNAQQLRVRLKSIKRVLIILDDVWENPNLEEIGIPFGKDHGGCKILLTTRRREVCSSKKIERKVQLDVLDEDDAWSFFKTVVGLSDAHPDIYKVAKEVALDCQGLPLLLDQVGRGLAEKPSVGEILKRYGSSKTGLAEICGKKDPRRILLSSYHYLRNDKAKVCFLLCSLFPKGYAIDVEDLFRYTMGLELYREDESVEERRRKVWQAIEDLKASYLLLEHEGKNVKMHNLAHECALLIASENESFRIESRVDIDKLRTSLVSCTATFMMARRTKEHSKDLACPMLEVLVFDRLASSKSVISRAFLEETKAVKEFILHEDALHRLGILRTLHLEYCQLAVDLSSLGNLIDLVILSFRGSDICELPCEIGSLRKLRMLDLYDCRKLRMIPSKLIQNLCSLEELCVGGPSFREWPFEVASTEGSNASLSEMSLLPFLPNLSLNIPSIRNPKDIVFPELQKYQIAINDSGLHHCYPISRALKVTDFSLSVVKELFRNVQYLHLDGIMGHQNLVPSLDICGLNELTFLSLRRCPETENIVDMKEQHVPDFAFSKLEELIIEEMSCLKKLCNGRPPKGFQQKLKTLTITKCPDMIFIVPAAESLKELRVKNCDKLQEIFHNDQILHAEENNNASLSCLTYLELKELPELRFLWNRAISYLSLRNLKKVLIKDCHRLTCLFSASLAQRLVQLKTLKIHGCHALKQVVNDDDGAKSADGISNTRIISSQCLPSLITLEITDCNALEYIFPISSGSDIPPLRELDISGCRQLKQVFHIDAITVELPHLRRLAFKGLTSLSAFSSVSSAVKELCLFNVGNQLCHSTTVLNRNESLEYLTIGKNEEIFQFQGGYFFSNLKKLILKELSKPQVIWKDQMQIVTLQNLTYLEVFKCTQLSSIFSLVLARNLPQLTYLKVQACENLEQIISWNQFSSSSTTVHFKSGCFPQLTQICIEDCNKLKTLFPVSLARLPKLKKFMVKDVSNLRQIFGHEDEEPSNVTDVKQCGKMIMRFVTYNSEPPYVRAQIEASLWPDRRDLLDKSIAGEDINPELQRDTNWRDVDKITSSESGTLLCFALLVCINLLPDDYSSLHQIARQFDRASFSSDISGMELSSENNLVSQPDGGL